VIFSGGAGCAACQALRIASPGRLLTPLISHTPFFIQFFWFGFGLQGLPFGERHFLGRGFCRMLGSAGCFAAY
jgi:hypothetical protein